ncbi:flagellar export protein FliJ [Gemmata sp. JC717]|uniref:Flagellar FliJ protein n=1 Tax=Gemmata algarum TaxID=2975278 RepID=A0ABU5F8B1_9BACT|nr:flagellar export protein FliJ [Gemmata algarum]MDY3555261.1 flagellar export protein FliJ [Gemmata algarum]MDY3563037.1 flagellar export protein FliJ [Gemmata algarum]
MKRFEFPLERLLRVKRQLERIAELELQRAQEATERARAHLQSLRDQLDSLSDKISASVGRVMAPQQWAAASGMAERVGRSIQVSEREVVAAEQRVLAAAQERTQLATEVEALSTLRRQQADKWQQEVQKHDQNRLDEMVQQRWQAAQGAPAVALYEAEHAA